MPKKGLERTPGAGKRGDLWGESGAERGVGERPRYSAPPTPFLYYLNFTDSYPICCNCLTDYKLLGEAKPLESPLCALGSRNVFSRNSRAVVTLWGIGRK